MNQLHVIGWIAAALVAALACWGAWLALVSWWYRVRGPAPPVLIARCEDGWELALHHRAAPVRRFAEPVVLCHGLAANRYTFEFDPPYSIARLLAAAGFDCFTLELRGTGGSRSPPRGRRWWQFAIDDHIRFDAPAAVARALEVTGAARAIWIGHSMGGLVGYAAAQGPLRGKLAGLVALGSPVSFAADPLVRAAIRLGAAVAWPFGLRQRLLSLSMAPWLGYVTLPLSDVIVNPRHVEPRIQRKVYARMISTMGRNVLRQLEDWVHHDAFRSLDRATDYRAGMKTIEVPALVMGGSQDRLAPVSALRAQHELLGSADKTLIIFGRDRGDDFDYGHGDLLFGTGAPREVYGTLQRWLEEHATPVAAAAAAAPTRP